MYGYEIWTIEKAEHQRIDVTEQQEEVWTQIMEKGLCG